MIFRLAAASVLVVSLAAPLHARAIEQACVRSERVGDDSRLCTCIQRIADQLLTPRDQRLAASFFRDPHRAQEIRMSDRAQDERFWTVYRQFGALAEQSCN
ncbi:MULTISPECIES: hypothetical protein [Meridianimarinicoccus]|uniref:hypothetical protein n=1 Tax=Meridianimarinicoccus zhengii TaxID=2056810 RepID=UPI000DAF1B9B|nr:hypothetical protein [Phycocomes zhengii]